MKKQCLNLKSHAVEVDQDMHNNYVNRFYLTAYTHIDKAYTYTHTHNLRLWEVAVVLSVQIIQHISHMDSNQTFL